MKRAGIITKILVFAVIAFLVFTIVENHRKINAAIAQREEYKDRIAELEVENDEMRRQLENSDADETIEEIAREEFDLSYPGEEIIKN